MRNAGRRLDSLPRYNASKSAAPRDRARRTAGGAYRDDEERAYEHASAIARSDGQPRHSACRHRVSGIAERAARRRPLDPLNIRPHWSVDERARPDVEQHALADQRPRPTSGRPLRRPGRPIDTLWRTVRPTLGTLRPVAPCTRRPSGFPTLALDLWILGGWQTQKRPDVESKRAAGVISFPTPCHQRTGWGSDGAAGRQGPGGPYNAVRAILAPTGKDLEVLLMRLHRQSAQSQRKARKSQQRLRDELYKRLGGRADARDSR